MLILNVEASVRNPSSDDKEVSLAALEQSVDPTEVAEQVERFLKQGYWVEVFSERTSALLAGPFDPRQPLPSYIF